MLQAKESENIIQKLTEILRETRILQGLSQNEVAKRAGLSHTMVMRVEKRERMPTIDTLLRMAAALKLDLWKALKQASE